MGAQTDEPILIAAQPRSGSSMTAGIFAFHGVWVGSHRKGDQDNPRGYFENTKLKNRQKTWTRHGAKKGQMGDPKPGWREIVEAIIREDGYEGGRWLFKFSALNWRVWHEFDPWWVKCRRDPASCYESCKRVGFPEPNMTDAERWRVVSLYDAVLDEIPGVDVDTQAVSQGDLTTIREAIEYCGLDFDEERTRDFILPRAWHYRSADHRLVRDHG